MKTMAKSKVRFGSYYPAESVIHSLDPRAKLVGLIIYIIAVFVANSYTLFALLYLFGAAVIVASRVPLSKVMKSIRGVLILLILTGVLNIFFTPGENVLWEWGILKITVEGLNKGALMVLRLIGLIAFSAILTLTTTPILLSDGIESLFKPLKRIKVPVHEFAMMMTIALRFIPILMDEADKIMKAQRSRGGDLSSGSISKRVKGIIAIIIPLFFNALKRADDLALAMEARGYEGDNGRTKLRQLKWTGKDTLSLVLVCLLAVAVVVMRFTLNLI